MKLKDTDTIIARYAKLPVTEPAHRFLVKVMEPLELCELEKKITFQDMDRFGTIPKDKDWDGAALDTLRKLLLEEWHGYLDGWEEVERTDQTKSIMDKLNKVKLIECDLLVPKDYRHGFTFEDGSYVENPHFVDYHDGAGPQLDGGLVYDKNGKCTGHVDPPGPRGAKGVEGKPNES